MTYRYSFLKYCLLVPLIGIQATVAEVPDPEDLDVDAIINESYNFLLNREPRMTDTEYALYEEVLPMVFDRPEVAILLLETMLADDDPESAAFSYVLANVYFSSDRYDLAEKHYKSSIDAYPDFMRAWVNLGILYYTRDRFAEAIPCFTKAISLGTQDAQVYGLLGYCLTEMRNPLAAEPAFLQAYTSDPTNRDWIEALLSLYLESKQYQRAELLLKELIKLKPDEKSYWVAYSSVLLSTHKKVEAITILEVLRNKGIAGTDEMLLLGDLYADQKLFPEALAVYESAAKIEPVAGADRMLRYARSLVHQEAYQKAERLLSVLEERVSHEQQIEMMEIQAQILQDREDWTRASATLEHILRMDPLNGDALIALGRIRTRDQKFSEAEFLFQQAYKLPEYTFVASIELANLALRDHHYQKGIDYLRNALRIEYRPEIEAHIHKLESMQPAS